MVDETMDDLRKITRLSAGKDGNLEEDYPNSTGLSNAISHLILKQNK